MNMFGADEVSVDQDGGLGNDIPQLADVAGPGSDEQPGAGTFGEFKTGVLLVQEKLGQGHHVIGIVWRSGGTWRHNWLKRWNRSLRKRPA